MTDASSAAVPLLLDAFGRVHQLVADVIDGLSPDTLAERPGPRANSIAWLVWHLTRIQDDHVADLAGRDQVWSSQGWFERFALPFPIGDTGYGHRPDDVAAVRVASGDLLTGYHGDVHELTTAYVTNVDDTELARIVDRRWDPPVTAAVRLISVVNDTMQHIGQAAYVRGLLSG